MQDFGGLLQQAQHMQRELRQVQEDLKKRTVVGESAGGMVKVYASGQQEILKVEIDKEAIDPSDPEMLEDLVLVATRNCMEKARELRKSEMERAAGDFPLPDLF